MIDVIIPAYNSHSTIFRTLASLSIQQFDMPFKVTIVNDGGEGYSEIVRSFSDNLDIQVIDTANNGPAIARQIGLESTYNPFVMFIDADDILMNTLALKILWTDIESDPDIVCSNSRFMTEERDGSLRNPTMEFVWLFGNLYRRNFIEENMIRFPKFSANEDLIFNLEINIKARQLNKKISYLDNVTYLWKFNKNSITRRDNQEYTYFDSTYHIIKGKTDLFSKFDPKDIAEDIVMSVWDFYFFWEESVQNRMNKPDYHNKIMEASKEYYSKFKALLDTVSDETWANLNRMKKRTMNNFNNFKFMDFIAIMKR